MTHGEPQADAKKERSPTRNAANLNLTLMYYGYASVSVRGPVSGRLYQFSRQQPVQAVDARDALSILKTRLFRRIK
jgi:hypothetical protein